ncbi:neprilysin-4-like [Ctenocephalides felis]|uniref:neprilysin-4-like n=1 Tax=Ctenocephalides felis TaxID=7515 RepID=UPI000E6E45F6|nr:neprilysin-4-like [Ctenocephalides felis]
MFTVGAAAFGSSADLPKNHTGPIFDPGGEDRDNASSSCNCGLGVQRDTGRLRWCPGSRWSRLLFVIPAALLPLLGLFVLLSSLGAVGAGDSLLTRRGSGAPMQRRDSCTAVRYGLPEHLEAEEREVLSDLRTSFIPPESVVPPNCVVGRSIRSKRLSCTEGKCDLSSRRTRFIGNLSTDITIWANTSYGDNPILKLHKVSNFTLENDEPLASDGNPKYNTEHKLEKRDDYAQDIESSGDVEFDVHSPNKSGVAEIQLPWKITSLGKDARPITDDDFKQSQQFELENAELLESPPALAPHAVWRGQGSPEYIRSAQAEAMKRYMDPTADPCIDFYQHACGNWERYNPIPPDKAGYDTFEMLRESLDQVLRELLVEVPKTTTKFTNYDDAVYKARALYESCMNYAVLKRRGNSPLLDLLDKLGGWPAINPNWNEKGFDWLQLTAQLRMYNNDILIAEWVGPDIKNSDEYVIQFDQTSLGLPTRDYYLESINIPYLNAYREYMLTITTLLGANPANVSCIVEEILDFETKLAQITTAPEDRRNVSVLYQRLSIGRLKQLVPQIDWIRYLNIVLERPINPNETVVMFALGYMQDLVRLLARSDARTVSNYLMWRFVRHRVNNLDDRFQPAKQKFYYVLFGREQSPPRWKNCVSQVNTNMGMALGSLFVRKYFDYTSKNDTTVMTSEIQQSFRELLYKTDWIDNQTKRLAAEKVNAIILRIGYPDYVLEPETLNDKYKDVNIDKGKYFENTLEILTHLTRAEQSRLGQLVNKTVWHTAPAVVNAYYSRNKNQIMFPAGILQPPFYHRYFPRSLNYGGIGVVIGHELTHGFDDKGRLFDKEGNLHKWWSEKSIDAFHERAQCLIDQYSNYTVPEVDLQIDGFNTQGENIADNGGIKQAFRAYRRWLKLHGNSNETLPGINATNTQLFFLNFAQVWCGAMRPEAMRNKLKTAVHSPGKFRVIGTLSNSEDFAREYNCPRGSPMNPIKKCSVW